MRWFIPVLFLFLSACKSTIPSETISQNVISDLNAHQKAIQTLEKQTTKECKTEAFVTNLNALKSQTESIAGQVRSISNACSAEKAVLEKEKTIRDILIVVLIGVLAILLFFVVRLRK